MLAQAVMPVVFVLGESMLPDCIPQVTASEVLF